LKYRAVPGLRVRRTRRFGQKCVGGKPNGVARDIGVNDVLVLTRKSQESVVVGGSAGVDPFLKVTVLTIRGGRVRLGFEVENNLTVHRWEVWEKLRRSGAPEAPSSEKPPPEVNL
jgi:carbon storage regulator CsrA